MEVLKPKNLLYLIIRPSRVFEIVKEKGVFLEQFLLYVIATFVYQLILPSPSKEQIESWVRENMKNPPTQNLEMTVKTMQFSLSPAVRAFSSLFGAGLVIVIFSLVVLVIVKILKGNINFKKVLCACVNSNSYYYTPVHSAHCNFSYYSQKPC